MVEEKKEEEAAKILMEERNNRIAKCSAEMEAVLNKYKCRIDVAMVLRANSIMPQVQIVSVG
jgi:hypothetical protein